MGERLVGQDREERLVLRKPAAEGVHERAEAVAVGPQEGAHVVLALHDLRQDRAAVHEVDRRAPRVEPPADDVHLARVGEHAVEAAGRERLPQDLLVGARLHLRPVRDRDPRAPGAPRRAPLGGHRPHEPVVGGEIVDGHLARELLERRQLPDEACHPVPVAEPGGRVRVHLDEAGAAGGHEGVEPGEDNIRRSRVERHPGCLGGRRAEEVAEAAHVAVEHLPGHPGRRLHHPDALPP